MIQLIASAAIQRLKAAIPKGQHPIQLSTVKEEGKIDNGDVRVSVVKLLEYKQSQYDLM